MPSNYDNSAWFYDRLQRMVYGKTLIKAQTRFLDHIPAGAKILIAGGGTGLLLEEIARIYPSGLEITYVELSANMMTKARQRFVAQNHVHFINMAVEDADLSSNFDVIITPFLLDSLSPVNFQNVFNSLHRLLKPNGIWLNIDFQLTGKWWQKPLLKTMYYFFRLIGCVENTDLSNIRQEFISRGYQVLAEQAYLGSFVLSGVYAP